MARGRPRTFIDDYLAYLLARASHLISAEFHVVVRRTRLPVLQWRVLATLADGQALSIGEVADIVLIPQSTLTRVAERMVAAGLLHRAVEEARPAHHARAPQRQGPEAGRAAGGSRRARTRRRWCRRWARPMRDAQAHPAPADRAARPARAPACVAQPAGRQRLDQRSPFAAAAVDVARHRPGLQPRRVGGCQQRRQRGHVLLLRFSQAPQCSRAQDHRHAVVDRRHQRIGFGGDDAAGQQPVGIVGRAGRRARPRTARQRRTAARCRRALRGLMYQGCLPLGVACHS